MFLLIFSFRHQQSARERRRGVQHSTRILEQLNCLVYILWLIVRQPVRSEGNQSRRVVVHFDFQLRCCGFSKLKIMLCETVSVLVDKFQQPSGIFFGRALTELQLR